MKIAIDVSQIVYETGVSTYTKNLVSTLVKIDQKNTYLLFGTSLRQFKKLNNLKNELRTRANVEFKLYRFPISFFEFIFNFIHILSIDKLIGRVDILHTSDWIEPGVSDKKTKKVTTMHDMTPYLFPSAFPKRILKNQMRRLSLVKRESDLIIADSKTTKDDTVKFLDIPQDRIKMVNLAVAKNFKPQPEDKIMTTLSKFKIKKPFILSVGTQEPRKNVHKLIDAFENLSKEYQELTLVLTGKKGWGQVLETVPNVIETGFVSEEELISLYAGCKVFVYPSLYEGFGLPILEAMACSAPTITSNNSSMVEVAKDAAILVDPRSDEQIKKAISLVLKLESDDYQKMVRASLDRARQFTWEKTARETLKVYEELVKKE